MASVIARLSNLVEAYVRISARYPKLVNGFTGFVIAGYGDYLCQRYYEYPFHLKHLKSLDSDIESTGTYLINPHKQTSIPSILPFQWDHQRTLNMALIRAFVITPFVLKWYATLVYLCPGTNFLRVVGRVMLDQSTGSPIVITLVFLSNSLLQNQIHQFFPRLYSEFFSTWKSGLQYWSIIHLFNFKYIPLSHQPLFAHFASVYWNAVLSYYANRQGGATLSNHNQNTS
jgi:hypothetical protein